MINPETVQQEYTVVKVNLPVTLNTPKFWDDTDIKAYDVSADGNVATALVQGTHYNLTGRESEAGGKLTVIDVPSETASTTILILCNPQVKQAVQYIRNDDFPAKTHENALDRLTRMIQVLRRSVSLSLSIDPLVTGDLKIVDGKINLTLIPDLPADQITSGILGVPRIPDLDASKIVSGEFPEARIGSSAVTTAKINDLAVTTPKIAGLSVDSSKIADSAVTTEKINDSAVTTAKINDAAITRNKIFTFAVDSGKINNEAVVAEKIGPGAVTLAKLNSDIPFGASFVINTEQAGLLNTIPSPISTVFNAETFFPGIPVRAGTMVIKAYTGSTGFLGVDPILLSPSSWDVFVILDPTLLWTDAGSKVQVYKTDTDQLVNSSVTTVKLGNNAVTSAKIADESVGTLKIAPGAISTSLLADGAVTLSKVDGVSFAGHSFVVSTSTAISLALSSDSMAVVLAAAFPDRPLKAGSLIVIALDSLDNPLPPSSINAYLVLDPDLQFNAVGAKVDVFKVTTDQILTGAVTTPKIADSAITSVKIAAGAVENDNLEPKLQKERYNKHRITTEGDLTIESDYRAVWFDEFTVTAGDTLTVDGGVLIL